MIFKNKPCLSQNLHAIALALTLFFVNAGALHADTLFEGWYEVYSGTKKVGFLVERYEFTNSQFKATKYLKTNSEGSDITESLKAFSGPDLSPLKYSYTSTVGKEGKGIKVIDATFDDPLKDKKPAKGKKTTEKDEYIIENIKTFDGKKEVKDTKRIKRGTFLSEFLLYMILQQKEGLTVGKNYIYNAIAEEDGSAYNGSALVKSQEVVKGKQSFKVLNNFKKEDFFTWVSTKGEPLLVRSPANNVDVRIAESQAEATKGLIVKLQDLKLLFGTLPGESTKKETPAETKKGKKAKKDDDAEAQPTPKEIPMKAGSTSNDSLPPKTAPTPAASAAPAAESSP